MKNLLPTLLLPLLGGCVATAGDPTYRAGTSSMVAPGYPIERIQRPETFRVTNSFEDSRTQGYSYSPSAPNSRGGITEAGVTWVSRDTPTAVASVYHAGLAPQPGHTAKWLNWDESEGTEEINGKSFQYGMLRGRYEDAVWNPNTIPSRARECAVGVQLITHSTKRDKRTALIYTEGRACNELNLHGSAAERELRAAAYDHFGLR